MACDKKVALRIKLECNTLENDQSPGIAIEDIKKWPTRFRKIAETTVTFANMYVGRRDQ
jgi:hypothetical protein